MAKVRWGRVLAWTGRLAFVAFFVYAHLVPKPPHVAGVSDKLEHAVLYALFGLVLWDLLPGTPQARGGAVLALGWILAIMMEVAQSHVPHRKKDVFDALADLAGLAVAVLLAASATAMRSRRRGAAPSPTPGAADPR